MHRGREREERKREDERVKDIQTDVVFIVTVNKTQNGMKESICQGEEIERARHPARERLGGSRTTARAEHQETESKQHTKLQEGSGSSGTQVREGQVGS